VTGVAKWNWDGDRILQDCIVTSSRPVVGYGYGGRHGALGRDYPIDAREFLVTERNAVMRRTLQTDVQKFMQRTKGMSAKLFGSRGPGAFDHRADVITAFVAKTILYTTTDGNDPWQFPDETLAVARGDCEDRALLLASLLLASGISSFNVRVAFGKVRMTARAGRRTRTIDRDHVWVMYKTEAGRWSVIEPMLTRKVDAALRSKSWTAAAPRPSSVEYMPRYLFNDVHLWNVTQPGEVDRESTARFIASWSKMHPSFAGDVHKTILNRALTPDICPGWVLDSLNRHFSGAVFGIGPLVDDVDRDVSGYDPRDHFDNGYISQGWTRVADRLASFKTDSVPNLFEFFRAAHGIADFYAHSSYAHFVDFDTSGVSPLCDPDDLSAGLANQPEYTAAHGLDLATGGYTENEHLWTAGPVAGAQAWRGSLISGRYGQEQDTWGGFLGSPIESATWIPDELTTAPGFKTRGALPHHNEIAVDEATRSSSHRLYQGAEYGDQFALRTDLAARHVRQAFSDNWTPPAVDP